MISWLTIFGLQYEGATIRILGLLLMIRVVFQITTALPTHTKLIQVVSVMFATIHARLAMGRIHKIVLIVILRNLGLMELVMVLAHVKAVTLILEYSYAIHANTIYLGVILVQALLYVQVVSLVLFCCRMEFVDVHQVT